MYNKISNDILEQFYQQNFPNDGQRFVAWYLRNIHTRDMNQTKDDMTDGSDDKQIDALFVDDDKQTIFVIQGKFIGSDSVGGEPLREILSAWMQLRDLVRLQEVGNPKLKRKLSEVAQALEEEYEVEFELVTTGEMTESANNDLESFQTQLVELGDRSDFYATIKVVDSNELKRRYDMAVENDAPSIDHIINLTDSKTMEIAISGNKVVIAAIPLKECITIPGITEGTLFQKNVRQSLGLSNRVNKGIKNTIYSDQHRDFFFYHNGITAICNELSVVGNELSLKGLSVVNGCQSLTTIQSSSEKVKRLDETYILFRFYEIPQRERGDKISVNTNSQSAVKPRDLRSNDKKVLSIKKSFMQKYPNGFFISKRGEEAPAAADKDFVLDMLDFGKYLIAWHSQRPNIAYSETKIFDKYFDQLFKKDYAAENAQALNTWMKKVWTRWEKDNPLGLNDSLLAMRAYAPYHHLYAISVCFGVSNSMPMESVPNPSTTLNQSVSHGLVDQIVDLAGRSLNFALDSARNEPQPANRVFSPQNWIRTKTCLAGIRAAVSQSLNMLPMMDVNVANKIKDGLKMKPEHFEARWSAD